VHPSLLPRWRGAAPVERAIMAGDDETGVTIMALVEDLDAGPVFAQPRERLRADDTYGSLVDRLVPLSADLLVHALDERREPVAQPERGVTYADKITAADRTLEPAERSAAELERTVRALTPHIGARIALPGGELLGVRAARVREDGPPPGEFDGLVVGTPSGALELVEVQPSGGRPMTAEDYLRGHPL
jgi:methionyl-tRNA formyltransferase